YVTDTDLSTRFPIYTRANVGEVFPDPVTPLTSDTALYLAEMGWRDAWVRMGAFEYSEFPDDTFCQLGVVGGYCYLNASIIRLFGERAPGLSWEAMDQQFFGAQPGIPPYEKMAGDERPDLTVKIGETFGWVLSKTSLDQLDELTADRNESIRIASERPDLSAMSDLDLWRRYEQLTVLHRRYFAQHLFTTYMATVPLGIISAVATAVGRPDLIMPIISGIGEVDSAAPSQAMWDMGRQVADSKTLTKQFDKGVSGLLDRLQKKSKKRKVRAFLSAFDDFITDFGSRGPNEWEARSPTWETRPELALSAIERMRLASDDLNPRDQNAKRARDREIASKTLLDMVAADPEAHGQLSAGIGASRAWLPARERTKTNNIRIIHEMRMPMRELGRRMVERGAFDEIEDFGFVRASEIDQLLDDPHSLTDTIRVRRVEYEALEKKDPQFVFVGEASDPGTWPSRDGGEVTKLASGESLQGMPGCPGSATGRARVILDSNDPTALEPGDILVAPITDPSWTPLFVPAAAVVVDVGAPLSHAIIVSRELGIPCVISATGGTRRIPDGAMVRVDGDTGLVTIL
ncbi:MAG: phosphoenolpyruvate-utilizing protein, partial [Actinobacteria bacterium]|nr:phosphoenolpyruvate-utilizing protein [Actinomycetota bacterium]